MPETPNPKLQPNTSPSVTHVVADRPVEVQFSFEHAQSRVGFAASIASHLAMGLIAFLVMRYVPEAQSLEPDMPDLPREIVWLAEPGPGGGGGGGAGTGKGSGVGPGQGSGLGDGWGGGTGGGPRRPGNGVSLPEVITEVKPQYTAEAMRAKVQGVVWLECIVMPDGSVGDVRVTKSLDSVFGLDQEAIKAARRWRFKPGFLQGQPVPVIITIELTFTLR
jgi:TonB family protein